MRFSIVLTAALGVGRAAASPAHEDDLVARAVSAAHVESTVALHTLEGRGLLEDIWKAITDAASCSGCQSVLALLKGLAVLGDGVFSRTIIEICKLAKVQDDDVCEGAIGLQAPTIRRAVQNIQLGSKPADLFCITFLGLCPYPAVKPFEPALSPRPALSKPKPSGRAPLKVVHIADIHIDRLYVPGANTKCSKPICCRPYTPAEGPGQTANPAGRFGDANCNTPVSLEESMHAAIKKLVPDAAFVLFTGDMVDAAVWNTSRAYNEKTIADSYNRMAAALPRVYAAVGNHEMHPTNLIPPKAVSDAAQWMYDAVAASVSRWVGASAAASLRRFGGYSVLHPGTNLRVLTLNTNLYYKNNYHLYQRTMDPDPDGQIAWLAGELAAAERRREHVWIVGHQALGDSSAFRDPTTSLDRLVARHAGSVRAMFFGHTHADHWQLTYADYANRTAAGALVTSYIAPSLTPQSGRNPAFRVYDVDPATFAIVDATTYYADLRSPSFAAGPVWKKYYSARAAYGPAVATPLAAGAELSAGFWHEVTEAFERDDGVFGRYLARKSRGYRAEQCAGECKDREVCQLRAARSESNCYKPKPGLNFRKRSAWEEADEREEDGAEVVRAAIGALGRRRDALELLGERVAEGRV